MKTTSRHANKRIDAIAIEFCGSDIAKRQFFSDVLLDAWSQVCTEIENHNDTLRQIAGFVGKHLGTLIGHIRKGLDVTRVHKFDLLVDHAMRHYPGFVAGNGTEEDGLVARIKQGILPPPKPWNECVIERAIGLLHPSFFEVEIMEETIEPQPQQQAEPTVRRRRKKPGRPKGSPPMGGRRANKTDFSATEVLVLALKFAQASGGIRRAKELLDLLDSVRK
jgi:hypothetical protein